MSTQIAAVRGPAKSFTASPESVCYRDTGRTRHIDETVELAWAARSEAHISRLADITDLDVLGIPIYNVYRPHAVKLNLTVSSGKGTTPAHSIASGLMEAIERHFGESRLLNSCVLTLKDALDDGQDLVDPRALTPDVRNYPKLNDEFEWVIGHRLDDNRPVRVPARAVYTPYVQDGVRSYESHSDGLVSGNTYDEALLHGMLELIERDACSFGELLYLGARIEPSSVPPSVAEVWDRFRTAGIEVHLFNFASPTGIPVCYAVGIDPDAPSAMLINGGAGASLDPERAALRALTELAQSRACVISGSREDFSTKFAGRKSTSLKHAFDSVRKWVDHGWEPWDWAQMPNLATGDLDRDVDLVRKRLQEAGLTDVYTVDLAPPDFPFSIIKVIIPGIEFVIESRYRLGQRFYDAARRAGVGPAR